MALSFTVASDDQRFDKLFVPQVMRTLVALTPALFVRQSRMAHSHTHT